MAGTPPTHRISAVGKTEGSDKSYWTEIGAAWPHKDGKGFNIVLNLIPRDGSDIVIRLIEPREGNTYNGK